MKRGKVQPLLSLVLSLLSRPSSKERPVSQAAHDIMKLTMNQTRYQGTHYARTLNYKPELLPRARDAFGNICKEGDDGQAKLGEGEFWDYQAGDFVLAARSRWQEAFAYPELEFTFGIDSSILCKFAGMGLRPVVLIFPCAVVHQHHEVRVNPNARQVVDRNVICERVAANPGVFGLHQSQRDPEMWGEHGADELSLEVVWPSTNRSAD